MYKELFALCQALPGPGSTKMLYSINVIHSGFAAGALSFFVWSLPAAIAAYGLALGVARIDERLPAPVYALLTGLNAATVGIIALAAVQLSQKAITDKLTRILVFFGGTAGILYNALWYFPVLMVAGGVSTVVWDYRWAHRLANSLKRRKRPVEGDFESHPEPVESIDLSSEARLRGHGQTATHSDRRSPSNSNAQVVNEEERVVPASLEMRVFSWKFGAMVIVGFFISFIIIMALRGVGTIDQRGFNLFANMYLAGTIIFGGGPVVIPLLREYVVAEGWVSTRDFLLGLAIIQAFPGPNFNFAVYLGSLAADSSPNLPSAAGAVIGYIAIFAPGLILQTGFMGLWKTLRGYRWFTSCLRGVNASAVGLVYTAVYRLWEIGYIDEEFQSGSSLGREPWFVVITTTSFVAGMWFKLTAPAAILLGGVMGMIWFGIVKT
ncbi:MAG: hypothetical protein Q9178_004792 [Gyalolechia marmorata]